MNSSITNQPYLIDYKEKITIENDYSQEKKFNPEKMIFPILIKYYVYMPHFLVHSVQIQLWKLIIWMKRHLAFLCIIILKCLIQ